MLLNNDGELDDLLKVVMAIGVGGATIRRLIRGLESFVAVGRASAGDISELCRIDPTHATMIRQAIDRVETAPQRAAIDACDAQVISIIDPRYPAWLAATPAPPGALWIRGSIPDQPGLAIVGARRSSVYGQSQSWKLARNLAERGVVVVSGGARGIDTSAHRGAVAIDRPTVVVLGSGVDIPYPPEHVGLFEEVIATGGAVVSQFPCQIPPRPGHFPRRNAVIAGLSWGVVVIEAARRSGAMITARLAVEELGREAMAFPGPVDVSTSEGCNQMLVEGWAAPVRNADDVMACQPAFGDMVQGVNTDEARL
jgi:DNA processing protein